MRVWGSQCSITHPEKDGVNIFPAKVATRQVGLSTRLGWVVAGSQQPRNKLGIVVHSQLNRDMWL